MLKENERPICHRAEDLVTYLYGESSAEEARDFTAHMQQCEACRREFNVFNQVHESIVTWRNEALGSHSSPVPAREDVGVATPVIVQHGRRLPALAALRQFFSVSPLWLRGATAFAGLLLCALMVFTASRLWRQPAQNPAGRDQATYTKQQLDQEVERQVAQRMVAQTNQTQESPGSASQTPKDSGRSEQQTQVATTGRHTKAQPRNRLTHEERVQLAADLGLIQAREEEVPFVLPEQPDQPNQ